LTGNKFALIATLAGLVAACYPGDPATPAPVTEITLKSGDNDLIVFRGGDYRVTWMADDCIGFNVSIEPIDGAEVRVPSNGATVTIPRGAAHVNRGGSCGLSGYTVTLKAFSGGSRGSPSPCRSCHLHGSSLHLRDSRKTAFPALEPNRRT